MKLRLFVISLIVLIVGCGTTPTATPTPAATAVPTLPPPTAAPTDTPLPPTPTPEPPTDTPQPTDTPVPTTPAPTATNTRRPVTPRPTATETPLTPTQPALMYPAPELVEPRSPASFVAGKDNLVFKWKPVGAIKGEECYLVTVRITNAKTNEYGEQPFIAANTCGDFGNSNLVSFTLPKRGAAPNYKGLMDYADKSGTSDLYHVTWNVVVVQNNGADPNQPQPSQYVVLSPKSETFEFDLRQ